MAGRKWLKGVQGLYVGGCNDKDIFYFLAWTLILTVIPSMLSNETLASAAAVFIFPRTTT